MPSVDLGLDWGATAFKKRCQLFRATVVFMRRRGAHCVVRHLSENVHCA